MNSTTGILIALLNPAALPILRIGGALFITLHLLAAAYIVRHRRWLFGRDPRVPRDISAVRHLRFEVVLIPWLFITTVLVVEWLRLWFN